LILDGPNATAISQVHPVGAERMTEEEEEEDSSPRASFGLE